IKRRSCEHCRKRSLRHEQVFERARVARFFKTMIKCVECGVQIVKKDKADKAEREIAAILWKRLAKFRTLHEARHVIEHRRAEECLHDFHHEWTTIRPRDHEIPAEK